MREEDPSGIYTAAVSPDGHYIALAVPALAAPGGTYQLYTAKIYIFEDGVLVHQLPAQDYRIPTNVAALRFSPASDTLAAVLTDGCGVRVWNKAAWLGRDGQAWNGASDEGYAGDHDAAYCSQTAGAPDEALKDGADVVFTGDPEQSATWLVTSAESGVRSYSKSNGGLALTSVLSLKSLQLERPSFIAARQDHRRIGVGDRRRLRVAVIDKTGDGLKMKHLARVSDAQLEFGPEENYRRSVLELHSPVWVKREGKFVLYAGGWLPTNALKSDPLLRPPVIGVPAPFSDDAVDPNTNNLVAFADDGTASFMPVENLEKPAFYACARRRMTIQTF